MACDAVEPWAAASTCQPSWCPRRGVAGLRSLGGLFRSSATRPPNPWISTWASHAVLRALTTSPSPVLTCFCYNSCRCCWLRSGSAQGAWTRHHVRLPRAFEGSPTSMRNNWHVLNIPRQEALRACGSPDAAAGGPGVEHSRVGGRSCDLLKRFSCERVRRRALLSCPWGVVGV